jgi:hypothetical protein
MQSSPNLNTNSSKFLPNIPDVYSSIDNLAFGIGKKNEYTASLNNSREFLEHVAKKNRMKNQTTNVDLKHHSRNDVNTFMPSIKKMKIGDASSRLDFQGRSFRG